MWYLFLILAIVIVLLIVLLIIFLKYKHNYWKYLDIPHDEPKQWNVIIQEMLGKIPNDYASKTQRYEQLYRSFKGTGPFCGFHVQLDPFVLVLERELVQRILIKDFSNFNDRGLYHNSKKDPLSSDLYCITANEWKEMRIKLDPIFRPEIIKALHNSSFNAEGQAHLLNAFDVALLNQPRVGINFVDVRPLVRRYVLASIAKNVFGLDVNLQARFPLNEFDEMTQLALNTKRHGKILNIFMQKYTNLGQKMGLTYTNKKAEKYFMNLIESVVEEREKKSPSYTNPDFLQLLIDIKTQEASTHISMTGRSNVDENKTLKDHLIKELAAHAFVFLREGLEPTTHAINCVLYELAEHQIYQHQVRAEVLDAVTRHGGELSYECLQEFKTLHKIILETIRLHPITPYITRRTLSDYTVPSFPKYKIPKDIFVVIPIHAMHNDAAYYDDPITFNPERFTDLQIKSRDPCMWLGFGDGPRNCIGMHLAELQIKIAVSRLLMEYKFFKYSSKSCITADDTVLLQLQRIHHVEGGREAKIVI